MPHLCHYGFRYVDQIDLVLRLHEADMQKMELKMKVLEEKLLQSQRDLKSVKEKAATTEMDLLQKYAHQQTTLTIVGGKVNMAEKALTETRSKLNAAEKELVTLNHKYNAVKEPRWPAGKYCLLRSGPCPKGFSQKDASINANSVWSCSIVRDVQFGSSSIRKHRGCSYGNYADIILSTCCKEY